VAALVTVIDYQAGNITSVAKALRACGAEVRITADAKDLRSASHIVLPGVGHFSATGQLYASGMADALRERVSAGMPFLGICVGLQWLFEGSTESPQTGGLGVFAGLCDRFPPGVKSPHVGWNSFQRPRPSQLLRNMPDPCFVYFTHAYSAPVVEDTTAVTRYGHDFTAAVERDNWMAVQFHPEKSGETGLQVLRNFLEVPGC
jgi:glutamine amidotransferase